MARLYVNNFRTNLAEAVAPSDTIFDLVAASGLGSPGGGDFVTCTIENSAGNREIIYVTGVSSNTITCTRGEEGTTALTWTGTETIEARLTAECMNDKQDTATLSSAVSYAHFSTQTASASTNLNFTNIPDCAYMEFVLLDVMLTSTDNGGAYDNASNDYNTALLGRTGATTVASSAQGNPINLFTSTAGLDAGNTTGETINGRVYLYNPAGTGHTYITWELAFTNADGNMAVYHGASKRSSAADVTAVRFQSETGNLTSGSIIAYKLSKT
jgi:hypothetical protein